MRPAELLNTIYALLDDEVRSRLGELTHVDDTLIQGRAPTARDFGNRWDEAEWWAARDERVAQLEAEYDDELARARSDVDAVVEVEIRKLFYRYAARAERKLRTLSTRVPKELRSWAGKGLKDMRGTKYEQAFKVFVYLTFKSSVEGDADYAVVEATSHEDRLQDTIDATVGGDYDGLPDPFGNERTTFGLDAVQLRERLAVVNQERPDRVFNAA